MKGKKEAKKIIEEFKPDLVIGTGGYGREIGRASCRERV